MFSLRNASRATSFFVRQRQCALTLPTLAARTYASRSKDTRDSKSKRVVSTENLVPGSQRVVSGEEYVKTDTKMEATIEKYRKEVAALETRASGRVTPALLAPVRVHLPDATDQKGVRLEEITTVGVRDGSTLVVTAFEEHTLKYIEQAIYDAKLPGIVPQRGDERTIKIPIPKPTVDARHALYTTAQRHAEDTRVQVRKLHQMALKKGRYDKHSPEVDEFQKLTDKHLAQIEKILAELKKSTGTK